MAKNKNKNKHIPQLAQQKIIYRALIDYGLSSMEASSVTIDANRGDARAQLIIDVALASKNSKPTKPE